MLNSTDIAKQEVRILAAATNPDCLDYVGLYTIMLAKRTGMIACLMFVTNETQKEGRGNDTGTDGFQEKIRMIQEAGADADVRIDYLITSGAFVEEVARYLQIFDSTILVVGEGDCKTLRKEELRRVKKILMADGKGPGKNSHHFLIVSCKNRLAAAGKDTSITDWIAKS